MSLTSARDRSKWGKKTSENASHAEAQITTMKASHAEKQLSPKLTLFRQTQNRPKRPKKKTKDQADLKDFAWLDPWTMEQKDTNGVTGFW